MNPTLPLTETGVDIYCEPGTHDPLEMRLGELVNPKTGRSYPVRNGITVFTQALTGQNEKYQRMYDRIARGYDWGEVFLRLYLWVQREKNNYRQSMIDELDLPGSARVLEVSIGTGLNVPYFPPGVELFGLDISWGMLSRARKNLARWQRRAELCQGEGENLPFKENTFDAVLHVGGINFFNDKERAIREMIRVAKPGAKIVIVDETEEAVKKGYERTPVIRDFYKGRAHAVRCPIDAVPADMTEVTAKELFRGKIYCLTFRKPAARFAAAIS
jgi:ubiquinone/menaquinone biosynthesis C-methylase UbiE